MSDPDRLARDRATIRGELERRARARRLVAHGELAALVGRTPRGLGRLLDAIKAEEARRGRPDLSCLAVRVGTGLPSYVGPGGRDAAIAAQEAVFDAWADAG